jgi:type IV secretory pathway VirB2 component (pilin)
MKGKRNKIKFLGFTVSVLVFIPFLAAAQLPQTGPTSWKQVFSGITQYVFNLGMAVAVIVIIWSGILFMTASGSEERVTKAKTTFFWALIGLAICLLGSGLVYLILDVLGGSSQLPSAM